MIIIFQRTEQQQDKRKRTKIHKNTEEGNWCYFLEFENCRLFIILTNCLVLIQLIRKGSFIYLRSSLVCIFGSIFYHIMCVCLFNFSGAISRAQRILHCYGKWEPIDSPCPFSHYRP